MFGLHHLAHLRQHKALVQRALKPATSIRYHSLLLGVSFAFHISFCVASPPSLVSSLPMSSSPLLFSFSGLLLLLYFLFRRLLLNIWWLLIIKTLPVGHLLVHLVEFGILSPKLIMLNWPATLMMFAFLNDVKL